MNFPIVDRLKVWLQLNRKELRQRAESVDASRQADFHGTRDLAAERIAEELELEFGADSQQCRSISSDADQLSSPIYDSSQNPTGQSLATAELQAALLRERERADDLDAQLKRRASKHKQKTLDGLAKSFKIKYPALTFEVSALESFSAATAYIDEKSQIEKQLSLLQNDPSKVNARDRIVGTKVVEIGYGRDGRMYLLREGSRCHVLRIGNKKTQKKDIAWIRSRYTGA